MASNDAKLKDLNLSTDEVKRIGECLKDENFRKLFVEYAEEISDPENRRRYEEEITQMENDRGMDVEFVHPQPGHVLKTSVDGNTKAFINICQNDKIDKPQAVPQVKPNGQRGINWQIPHSFSPPREDVDKNKETCKVFDVVFNPDTYRMGNNPRFMVLIEDTALEGIETQFGVVLDKQNIKRMKSTKYKGIPVATVIRKKTSSKENTDPNAVPEPLKNMPYPYSNKSSEEIAKEMRDKVKADQQKSKRTNQSKPSEKKGEGVTKPKYSIVHRSDMDLQNYTNGPREPCTRPKELVITVELPLLSSAKDVNLDIFERRLLLESIATAKYALDLKLPYPVDSDSGGAKFDKSKRTLTITLPVLPMKEGEMAPIQNGIKEVGETIDEIKVNGAMKTPSEGTEVNGGTEVPNNLPPLVEPEKIEGFDDLPPLGDVEEDEEKHSTESIDDDENTAQQQESPARKQEVDYSYPAFTYHQDDGTVSFVINEKNAVPESVSKTFSSAHSMCIRFYTLGSGGFPFHYSLHIEFAAENEIVPDQCSVDIEDTNLVVLALKAKQSRGLWRSFRAGQNENNLQEHHFLTESTLALELNKLSENDVEDVSNNNTETNNVVEVTEMNKQKLTVKIKKGKKKRKGKQNKTDESSDKKGDSQSDSKDEEEEELMADDDTMSPEIQVVHDQVLPNLHGILKQRSMSESSTDDYSSSCSPTSPREDPAFKKSVSFNDNIEKTSYRTGESATSVSKTLMNKRRKIKKREEKRNGGRRRQNSGGSEGSTSGEEADVKHSDYSDHSQGEEEGDPVARPILTDINEDSENSKEAEELTEDGDTLCGEEVSKVLEPKDERTNSENKETSKSVEKEEVVGILQSDSNGNTVTKSGIKRAIIDDVQERTTESKKEKNVKVIEEEGEAVALGTLPDLGDHIQNLRDKDRSIIKVKADESKMADDSDDENEENEGNDNQKKELISELWSEENKQKEEETSNKANNSEDLSLMDHATKCAFTFSNDVMFDLDVD